MNVKLESGGALELVVANIIRDEKGSIIGFGIQDPKSNADYSIYNVAGVKA